VGGKAWRRAAPGAVVFQIRPGRTLAYAFLGLLKEYLD
jgi:hypothetical protein